MALLAFPAAHEAVAASKNLGRQIADEQARAKSRRASLSRLTDQERALDTDLAAAEQKVLKLEETLAGQQERLAHLAASDEELQIEGARIEAEQAKTREAMTDVLRVLWELHARQTGVKGRDMPDWPVTDREHAWSMELFENLDGYRKKLESQKKDLEEVGKRRATLAKEVESRVASLNREKEQLLQSRTRYTQRLAEVRRQKRDTETELESILDLVRDLNLRLQEVQSRENMSLAKGKLAVPITGTLKTRYSPGAASPSRGLTYAVSGDAPVRAVHWGKVVHNDILRGLGRVVILMHGEEYFSLYASLSESPLRVGQDVTRGEVIGTSGFVPSLNGPGLYFELRFHQKAINPEPWFARK